MLNQKTSFGLPNYTIGEEIMNAATHGVGAILSVAALIFLLINFRYKGFSNLFCFSVYGCSLIILYTISTLYHSLKTSKVKKIFRKLDHCSIFLLIAGTYTPLSVLILKGVVGIVFLSAIWVSAVLGIILNSIDVNKFAKFSLCCYIAMGWAVVFAFKPLAQNLNFKQLFWLFTGGAAYTLGAIIYVIGKKIKFMHSVWHIFVLAGSISHFIMFI